MPDQTSSHYWSPSPLLRDTLPSALLEAHSYREGIWHLAMKKAQITLEEMY